MLHRAYMTNNWQNCDFNQQLELNKRQLNEGYPDHWNTLVRFVKNIVKTDSDKIWKILDLGCGCGATCQLLYENFQSYNVLYTGLDISEQAIELAKKNFPVGDFLVQDFNEGTGVNINKFDIVLQSAFVEVNNNGLELFQDILSYGVPWVISQRMRLTNGPSRIETHGAYNIESPICYHNKDVILDLIWTFNYHINDMIELDTGHSFLLEYDTIVG